MKGLPPLARAGVSVGLLILLLLLVDTGALLERLGGMDLRWAAAGVAISLGQVVLLAWRWRYTARRVGLALGLGEALREYYLGIFLNQLLPGGVVGDAARGVRHAGRGGAGVGAALGAVVVERATTQAVMSAVAVVSVGILLLDPSGIRSPWAGGAILVLVVCGLGAVGVAAGRALARGNTLRGRGWREAGAALLSPGPLAVHLGTGALAVASYLAVFLTGARAVGVSLPAGELLPLAAPVLMTMLLPLSVAGWGLREGAAAALWSAVSLPAEEGVLVSVAYGVLVLASALPGGVVLLWGRATPGRQGPGRRERPPPGERSGNGGEGPGPGTEPDGGSAPGDLGRSGGERR